MSELQDKEAYDKIMSSGMFWEFFPTMTGNWEEDKEEFSSVRQNAIQEE